MRHQAVQPRVDCLSSDSSFGHIHSDDGQPATYSGYHQNGGEEIFFSSSLVSMICLTAFSIRIGQELIVPRFILRDGL
jgi:hypothetical protein